MATRTKVPLAAKSPVKPVKVAAKSAAAKKPAKAKPAKVPLESPLPLATPGEVAHVFLDANVLLTQYVRACVLELAEAGLCHVYWTQKVVDEVRRNLVGVKFKKTEAEADHLLAQLSAAFPEALVTKWEPLEPTFAGKTNAGDQHVAAGALQLSQDKLGGEKVILMTNNSRHLPHSAFIGTSVQVAKHGTVLKELLAAQPLAAQALEAMVKRFKKPVSLKPGLTDNRRGLLERLDASNCRSFATALGLAWGL
jgi:hypothetical protein